MPAGSEPTPSAELPVTFRPLGVRIATLVFGVVLLATLVTVWLGLSDRAQSGFTFAQRATVALVVLAGLVVGHALARCRVEASEDGLVVVNGYASHRLDWQQVVSVSLRPGSPWAVLDLNDGTTRAAMGIQGSDGARAVRQTRQLRRLVEAHAAPEPPGDPSQPH